MSQDLDDLGPNILLAGNLTAVNGVLRALKETTSSNVVMDVGAYEPSEELHVFNVSNRLARIGSFSRSTLLKRKDLASRASG